MRRLQAIPYALLALLLAAAAAAAPTRTTRPASHASPRDSSVPAASRAVGDSAAAGPGARAASAASDSAMILRGGQEGTVFRTLTVEGEDRVHVDFERPTLDLDLDPTQVPGLDLGTARDVLDRTLPDLVTPMLSVSSADESPYLARPWLRQFGTGALVRFRPETRNVERWKLIVADSRGRTVRTFEGRGRPPEEIAWDGRTATGATAVPGLTYSYAFEAYDRAGNRRNLVGPGFGVSAFVFEAPEGPALTFSGRLLAADGTRAGAESASTIVLEAASLMNQRPAVRRPLRVTATARTREQAADLAARVVRELGALTLGDPAYLQAVSQVEPDAPEDGVIHIAAAAAR